MARIGGTRLALDEDVRPLLAKLLRDRAWDAVSALEAGRSGRTDLEQLEWASREGRALITHNAGDFAQLAATWAVTGRSHGGLLILRQGPIGWQLREVLRALVKQPLADDWVDRLVWSTYPPGRGR